MSKRIRVTVVSATDGRPTSRIFRNESKAWEAYESSKRARGLFLFGCIGEARLDSYGVDIFTRWRHFARDLD